MERDACRFLLDVLVLYIDTCRILLWMRDSPYVNSETYLAVILEEGRDVWEISLPEYHPQHLPLCPPFIVYNKCKIARYKVKVREGGEKNPKP